MDKPPGSSHPELATKALNPKRHHSSSRGTEPPRKRLKHLLPGDDLLSDSEESSGGAPLPPEVEDTTLTINEEFARRFEHNKRREELHQLEEKYGKQSANGGARSNPEELDGLSDSSSESEEEDDNGALASGELDGQFQATLMAIKTKDPRVYNRETVFYDALADGHDREESARQKSEKPMYLSDYHRRNILQGITDTGTSEHIPTYADAQDKLRATIVQEMHTSANQDSDAEVGGDDNDDFLVRKPSRLGRAPGEHQQRTHSRDMPDVDKADEDPDKYLSDFMSARAWVPDAGSRFLPFQSDDEDEEKRADEFEEAYNMRFEDPSMSNQTLISHARDAVARHSVRREATAGRKKGREAERDKKDAERSERENERARLRKLRIAGVEEKVNKIREAAGLRKELLNIDDWSDFLQEGWDDERWEAEMQSRFGATYYASRDLGKDDNESGEIGRGVKKPKWKDDIDIQDLVPDFEEHERPENIRFNSSNSQSAGNTMSGSSTEDELTSEGTLITNGRRNKQKAREKSDSQKQTRKQRRQVEQLVDGNLEIESRLADMGSKHAGLFRYRETSPSAYGLTAHDILMASDSQLNQYTGLKKLAAFRDPTKKSKDRKHLGKKARLRQWRKETFGSEAGPQQSLAELIAGHDVQDKHRTIEVNAEYAHRKRPKHKAQ
ncbi:MAG: hypothetical protein Q9220_001959 [cf. Caloplaca sp. 1 TL-2023]